MTNRPEQETIGCAPAGDRSMIESRRCPKASPASLSVHAAHPSGPRCATAFAIEIAVAASSSGERRPRLSHTPATPHIQNVAPVEDSVRLIGLPIFAERQASSTEARHFHTLHGIGLRREIAQNKLSR